MASLYSGRGNRVNNPSSLAAAAALNIQTSIQGRPRAIGAGTTMLAGNVIDIQDFQPVLTTNYSSGPNNSAGKGGHAAAPATPTQQWTYYATVLISLCEGPITSVNAFSGDGLTMSTWPSPSAGGTVFLGTQTQTAWSYMASRHPDHALSYRGEAYVAFGPMFLGTSSSVLNFTFEVTFAIHGAGPDFPLDANPRDWLPAYLTNAQWGVPGFMSSLIGDLSTYGNYCQALGLVISPILADQSEGSQHVADLMEATNSEIVWSNGVLNVVPYGDQALTAHGATYTPDNSPVYVLEPSDFLPLQGGDSDAAGSNIPISIQITDSEKLKNIVRLSYLDRSNLYTETPLECRDEASVSDIGPQPTDVRIFKMFCLQSAASMSAALQLTREQVKVKFSFTLRRSFIRLDPMDKVSLPLDYYGVWDEPQIVRIKKIDENGDKSLTFTCEEFLGTASAPLYARQATSHNMPDRNVDPGNINTPVFFELPDAISQGTAVYAGISSSNPMLGGVDVFAATDAAGTNYVQIDQVRGISRMGVTTAALPIVTPVAGDYPDLVNVLSVDLSQSGGVLSSGDLQDMMNRSTLCYLGGELIAYENAALTSLNHYNLSPLLRGAYSSPISAHPIGTPFVRVDGNVVRIPFEKARAGTTVHLKFVPFNVYGGYGPNTIATVPAYTYTLKGTALEPEDTTNSLTADNAAISTAIAAIDNHKKTLSVSNKAAVATANAESNSKTISDVLQQLASVSYSTNVRFGDAAAATRAEQTSRATADYAAANSDDSLVAGLGITDADTLNAGLIDTINAYIRNRGNQNAAAFALAAVRSTQDALTTANGAFASFGQQAYVQFGQLSASIQINADALASAAGSYASLTLRLSANDVAVTTVTNSVSTINGNLSARYTVDLDVNGIATNFSIINGGTFASTAIKFRADKFQIYSSSGANTNAAPMFALVNVNGVAQMSLDGNMFPDLGVLNRAIANNAVTNQGTSTGTGASGAVNFNVRAGSKVRLIASTNAKFAPGATFSNASPPTLRITLNGTIVVDFPLWVDFSGTTQIYPATAVYPSLVVTAGSWTASALARYFDNGTGNVNQPISVPCTIDIEELNK
jgi:hypothetical protein